MLKSLSGARISPLSLLRVQPKLSLPLKHFSPKPLSLGRRHVVTDIQAPTLGLTYVIHSLHAYAPWWVLIIAVPVVLRTVWMPLYATNRKTVEKLAMLMPHIKSTIQQQQETDPFGETASFENIYEHFRVHPFQLAVYPIVLFLHVGAFRLIYRGGGESLTYEGIPGWCPDLTVVDPTHLTVVFAFVAMATMTKFWRYPPRLVILVGCIGLAFGVWLWHSVAAITLYVMSVSVYGAFLSHLFTKSRRVRKFWGLPNLQPVLIQPKQVSSEEVSPKQ